MMTATAMTREQALAALQSLNAAIGAAVVLIDSERETIQRFIEEEQRMESIGPIVDPTLFMKEERRAVSALLSPIYREALNLSVIYHRQLEKAAEALEQVTDG